LRRGSRGGARASLRADNDRGVSLKRSIHLIILMTAMAGILDAIVVRGILSRKRY